MKIKNISVEPLFKNHDRQESEILHLHHPAQIKLRYFLAWFQSLQLPSTQSESPLAPKSHVSFKVCILPRTVFVIFRISTRINRNLDYL
jgi:hypothetical protein